jgi:hypothetical protein
MSGSSATRRAWCVFVSFSTIVRSFRSTNARAITNSPAAKSTFDHRSADTSPRRPPTVADSRRNTANS